MSFEYYYMIHVLPINISAQKLNVLYDATPVHTCEAVSEDSESAEKYSF